jgi:hypothetical protein
VVSASDQNADVKCASHQPDVLSCIDVGMSYVIFLSWVNYVELGTGAARARLSQRGEVLEASIMFRSENRTSDISRPET